MEISRDEALRLANEIANPHGLTAEFIDTGFVDEILRVGVVGDARVCLPVIVLVGPWPPDEVISDISTRISNATGGYTVNMELARRDGI